MPFEPGQSGNPGGKPPKQKLLAEKLLSSVDAAVAKLIVHMQSGDESISLRATCEVLDRVYGKASQSHDLGEAGDKIVNMILKVAGKE